MIKYNYDEESQKIERARTGKWESFLVLLGEGRFISDFYGRFYRKTVKLLRKFDELYGHLIRANMMKKEKVVPNRITFGTFQESYADNCKYIADKILERGLDYEMIFIVSKEIYLNKHAFPIPPQVRLVRRNTMESFYALATSKFWFDNALICVWKKVPKKPEQIYINTWHGSLGIKKLSGNDYWQKVARYANTKTDYFLTDSVFDEQVFSESYWPDVKHLKVGHPRNDLFFDKEKMLQLKKKVYAFYHISPKAKTAMYAPTFRDDKKDISAIDLDYQILGDALRERFGGEWVIISRLHHHNAKNIATRNKFRGNKHVIDASMYPDMQELMAAVDVGITDYSSWIFDYLFTGRPSFIYAGDIDQYRDDRGFYYSLDETPFLIASTNEMLGENVRAFDEEVYNRKVQEFLDGKGCYEAGDACDKVVDFIVEHTNA